MVVPPDWSAASIKYVVTRRCRGDHVGFALIGRVTAQDALAVLGPALDHARQRPSWLTCARTHVNARTHANKCKVEKGAAFNSASIKTATRGRADLTAIFCLMLVVHTHMRAASGVPHHHHHLPSTKKMKKTKETDTGQSHHPAHWHMEEP